MRSLTFSAKKLRGQRHLFGWLQRWANSFSEGFPEKSILEYPYWNWKVPVPCSLVEGRRARRSAIIRCAQLLLEAAANLAASRPEWAKDFRVVCLVATPDTFTSEVCIYMDAEYFQRHISPARDEGSVKNIVTGKSLARRWGLKVPAGFQERGLQVVIPDPEDGEYRSEWWIFGELR